jgi:transcriptional regulator with XRE-family HTH domain
MKVSVKDRLKQAMNYRNMTAADLCRKGHFAKATVSYWLNGRNDPNNEKLYLLAKILDVSEAWLLGYDVKMDRDPAQKEIDELAEMVARIKKDPDFRDAVLSLHRLDPDKLNVVKNFLNTFQ